MNVQNQFDFTITPHAAARLRRLAEKGHAGLRIDVLGGGCNGFQYDLKPGAAEKGDIVIERDGGKVFLAADALEFLRGSVLDYESKKIRAQFKISNPNAISGCGCGSSFAV